MKTLRIFAILLLLFNGTGAMFGGWIIIQGIMLRQISYLHFIFSGMGIALLWTGWILKRKST